MKSIHTRLDHQKDKVLKVTELLGRPTAMREFEVADYVCFSNWIEEVTGDKNFGIYPKIRFDGRENFTNQLAIKVIRKLLDLQDENKELHKEVQALRAQLSGDGHVDYQETLAIVELCQA